MKNILIVFSILFLTSSCEGLIYLIRGPKYEGKFESGSYPKELDSTHFYYRIKDYGSPENPDLYYQYLRFRDNGELQVMSSRDELLGNKALDSMCNVDYGVYRGSYVYKRKKNLLKWEFYSSFYEGFSLYKAEIVGDSIVKWRVPYKRISSTYYKTPD
jgi:hypothetical protein